jgi:ADP-ribose pyrophosphatase YjhB (NUDIX family)
VTAVPPWLDWGRRLAAIAREGLTWSREPFDRDRYERVAAVADELLAGQAGPRLATDALFPPGSGHPTPKVDVRAVIVRDGRVLLVRERTDGGWAMPGGWADPGLTAAQVAVKETDEEAGLAVRATRLLALWDRDAQGMEPYAHAVYKAYLSCEPLDPAAEPVPGAEALDAGWFEPAALPELSLTRNTAEQVRRLLALAADPAAPAAFD